ncbi:MAG: DoxX family membrane protein [Chitinivibrionales bacterium]|nr:DoxX family membrane protein [Chitinivibrionales bacterium]
MLFKQLDKYRDVGLLMLRLGIGFMFVLHGYPKLAGGPEKWTALGGAMSSFGITFVPAFWGFMAACAEFFGGLLLMAGLLTRISGGLLLITMLVAAVKHIAAGDGLPGYSHAVEAGILFLSLIFIGPGIYSLDELLDKSKR